MFGNYEYASENLLCNVLLRKRHSPTEGHQDSTSKDALTP